MEKKNLKVVVIAAAVAVSTVATSAYAVLPAAIATTVSGIQADGQATFDLVFPVIAVFVGLGVIVTLFKRFTKKV